MNVRFFGGRKSEYAELSKHNPTGLFLCADTRELFWGDWLLSDGIRIVPTYSDLPSISEHKAAEGIIYYVVENRTGYVLSPDKVEWFPIFSAAVTDIGSVSEQDAYNTAVSVLALRELERAVYEKIASVENVSGVKTISFAGIELTKVDRAFSIDRETALKALGISIVEGDSDTEVKVLATKEYVDTQIGAIPEVDLTGLASEDFVIKKIAEAELNDKDVDLSAYYTKTEVDTLIPEVPSKISELENDTGFITEHQSIEHLATKTELEDAIKAIEHPTVDLSGYAKEDYVKAVANINKYEVLPMDGMFVTYSDTEVRVNTEHVDINALPPQTAGDGSSDSYYYMTLRAYAPANATSVIEGSSDKMDSEHSTLATDKFGRKYTTIWPAIANKSNNAWSKYGDKSTVEKYLGFYYNFHWYADDKLISKDKVRVILTNDTCHNDLVPDAVARRIDDKVSKVSTPDLSGYAKKSDIPDVSKFITEVPAEYVTETELAAKGYITEHQSLDGYATEDYVKNAIAEAELNDKDVDISGLATKDEIKNLASVSYVDEKVAGIEHPSMPTKVSELENDSGFITDIPSEYITEEELESKGYLTEHQDLSEYAKKAEIPVVDGFATKEELTNAIESIEHPTVNLDNYVTKDEIEGFISEVPAEYITEDELEAKGYLTQHQDISHLATKAEIPDVSNFALKSDVPDVSSFITMEDVEAKGYISDIPTEYVTETELESKGFLTEHQDLSEYAKRDELPNLDGLATEEFVAEAIADIELPEADLSDYYTKTEMSTVITNAIASKADKIPFVVDKFVTNPIGGLTLGYNLNGVPLIEILAKLLELSDVEPGTDEPEIPDDSQSIVESIMANNTPMYAVTSAGNIEPVTWAEVLSYDETTAVTKPETSGFYQITKADGTVEYGYQQISAVYNDLPYLIALPSALNFSSNVTVQSWNDLENKWDVDDVAKNALSSDVQSFTDFMGMSPYELCQGIDTDNYTIWFNLDVASTGIIYRFIINE